MATRSSFTPFATTAQVWPSFDSPYRKQENQPLPTWKFFPQVCLTDHEQALSRTIAYLSLLVHLLCTWHMSRSICAKIRVCSSICLWRTNSRYTKAYTPGAEESPAWSVGTTGTTYAWSETKRRMVLLDQQATNCMTRFSQCPWSPVALGKKGQRKTEKKEKKQKITNETWLDKSQSYRILWNVDCKTVIAARCVLYSMSKDQSVIIQAAWQRVFPAIGIEHCLIHSFVVAHSTVVVVLALRI